MNERRWIVAVSDETRPDGWRDLAVASSLESAMGICELAEIENFAFANFFLNPNRKYHCIREVV